jgi:D-alanine-D-alanine ligase
MHVALLAGGLSREKEVSLMSGTSVYKALLKLGHKITVISPDRDFSNIINKIRPDVVFNALHGSFGEDGVIPGVLEMLGIPYTHSGIMASAIAMNKIMAKRVAVSCGIQTAQYLEMDTDKLFDELEQGKDPMPMPYVIKAISQGSSVGVYLIMDLQSIRPRRAEWEFGPNALVEAYIPGKELSVAVLNDETLGVMELNSKFSFYNYQAKYTDGITEHIYPADIPTEVYQEVMRLSSVIHRAVGCRTISRVDFRFNPALGIAGLFFLEINTHPGFTDLSIFNDIAKRRDYSMEDLVQQLLKDARCEVRA